MVCRNHPAAQARRNCYQCRVPICPSCQTKAHHHIFCGQRCIDLFVQKVGPATDLSKQLETFDQGVTEDLREFVEIVGDTIRTDFERLETELDQALTALATMVEGGAVAASKELSDAATSVRTEVSGLARQSKEQWDGISDAQSSLHQNFLSLRSTFLELKDRIQESQKLYEEKVQLLVHQTGAVHTKLDTVSIRQTELHNEGIEKADRRASDHESALERLRDESLPSLGKNLKEHQDQLGKNLTQAIRTVEDELGRATKELAEQHGDEQVKLRRQLEKAQEELSQHLTGLKEIQEASERESEGRLALAQAETRSQFEQLAAKTEATSTELRKLTLSQASEISEQILRMQERLESKITAQLTERIEELSTNLSAKIEELGQGFETNLAKATSSQQLFSDRVSHDIIETTKKQSGSLDAQVRKELRQAVDDISALTTSQREKWDEILVSARKGTETLVRTEKLEAIKLLATEVDSMANEQSKALQKIILDVQEELKKQIRKPKAKTWQPIASMAAVIVACFVGFGLFVELAPSANRLDPDVEGQISAHDASLKAWVEQQMKGLSDRPDLVPLPSISRATTARKEVAFTFDGGGENAKAAASILATLKDRNIHSTFFVTGDFIKSNPDLLKRIVAEGHEVANHLVKHEAVVDPKTYKSVYSKADFLRQLSEMEKQYQAVMGQPLQTKLWRAPFGLINDEVIQWAAQSGYRHVGWTRGAKSNLDTLDWVSDPKDKLYRTSDQIAKRIFDFEAKDSSGLSGAIVLMHLGTQRVNDFPYEKLPEILDRITKSGYKLVTLSQALRSDVTRVQ